MQHGITIKVGKRVSVLDYNNELVSGEIVYTDAYGPWDRIRIALDGSKVAYLYQFHHLQPELTRGYHG